VRDWRTANWPLNSKRNLPGVGADAAKEREAGKDRAEMAAGNLGDGLRGASSPTVILPRNNGCEGCERLSLGAGESSLDSPDAAASHRTENKVGEAQNVVRLGRDVFNGEFVHRTRVATPNDPKLSDGGGWRDGCAGEGGGAASVTAGAVRCSAWLGVAGFESRAFISG